MGESCPKTPAFAKAAVIGVGLIGGSLAMVMKEKGLCRTITGIGRTRENLETALSRGMIDELSSDIAEGVRGADLVIAAVPVRKIGPAIREALRGLSPPCLITDAGSVKAPLIGEVEPMLPEGIDFVPAHPVAGTEESGAGAAFSTLFRDRLTVITPTQKTPEEAVERVRKLWESAGSRVVTMDATEHDRVFALVSHLPHVIAYALVNTVAGDHGRDGEGRTARRTLDLSAGGFRDFTRIASSSPEMWADICAMNRDFILRAVEEFEKHLKTLRKCMEDERYEKLRREFERAKNVRDSI